MVQKNILLSVLILPGLFLQAQTPAGRVADQFRAAESDLVLLKNEGNQIPVQGLDTLAIASLGIGLEEDCDFLTTLRKYTRMTDLSAPFSGSGSSAEIETWARTQDADFDLFIVGIKKPERQPMEGMDVLDYLQVKALVELNKTMVVVFGENPTLQAAPWLNKAKVLLVTPENFYAQSLAAQVIFGGAGARGKLKQDWNTTFPTGSGLSSPGGLRLRYSPPEVVGMDPQLLRDSIRAIVGEGIREGAYPGAQVLVAKDGHVIYHEAFGFHTFEAARPVGKDDIYDFASVTKISSGLPAVMKLYGEGRFDLDAPLRQYLPEWKNSNKADLTFRRMLTHSSRLMAWIPFWRGTLRKSAPYPWRKRWNPTMDNDGNYRSRTFRTDSSAHYNVRVTPSLWLHGKYQNKMYKAIRKSPLNEKPGYVYSDLSFYLWPEILPRLTGQPFEDYLKQTFYRPLGAFSLTYNAYRHFPSERIIPTERDTFFRMLQIHGTVHDEGAAMLSGISGHAGLFGSANDLAKIMQLYLNGGIYGGHRYIAEGVLEEFTRYQYPEEGLRRGLGFDKPLLQYNPAESYTARSAGTASYGHSGYTGTFTWADPEEDMLIIFFSNRVFPTRDNRKLYELGIRQRLHQVLYDSIR